MPAGRLLLLSHMMGEPMEMTAIVAALLAAAGGLVVLAAFGLRSAAAHRQDLLAAGVQVADLLHLRRLVGICRAQGVLARSRRPAWLFGAIACRDCSSSPRSQSWRVSWSRMPRPVTASQ